MNKFFTRSILAIFAMTLLTSFLLKYDVHQHSHESTFDSKNIAQLKIPTDFTELLDQPQIIKTLVIDAGHGGKDGGCKGATTAKEKEVTLKIALKLGKYVEKAFPEINVVYTRKTDKFVPLHERAHIANKNKADLFISIHCNAVPKLTASGKAVSGTETYVMGLHTADENLSVAKRENEVILLEKDYKVNYDGFDPNSPEGHIMLSMFQDAHLNQSISFASKIDNQFRYKAKRKSRGVKQAGFVVLRQTTMPSVLIEAGFLTNKYEEKFLKTAYGQDLIASAIFRAFKDYYNEQSPARAEFTSKSVEVAENTSLMKPIKGIVYKVQLASSSKTIDTRLGNWVNVDKIEIAKEKGIYKYMSGNYYSYTSCLKAQKILQGHGFKDAFIVAYQNGEKISVAEAKKETGK